MWSLSAARCRGADVLGRVRVPALVIQSTADQGVFPSDARAIYDNLGSADKRFELVRGRHYFEDDDAALEDAIDLIAGWTAQYTG